MWSCEGLSFLDLLQMCMFIAVTEIVASKTENEKEEKVVKG